MHSSEPRTLSFSSNRSLWLVSFGAACALMTWFPGRVGVVRHFNLLERAYAEDLIVVALLVVMAFLWDRKPRFRIGKNRFAIAAIWLIASLAFAAQFTPLLLMAGLSSGFGGAVSVLYKLSSTALLLLWLECLNPRETRALIWVMCSGLLCLALVQLFLLIVQSQIAQTIFAIFPTIIVGTLIGFRRLGGSEIASSPENEFDCGQEKNSRFLPAVLCISLGILCFGLICSSIQAYVTRNNSVLLGDALFGSFDVVGTILTAFVFLALARTQRLYDRLRDILLIIPSILTLSYILTIALPFDQMHLSFVPLAIARRLIVVFWLIEAMVFPQRFLPAASFSLAVYRVAQMAGINPLATGAMEYTSTDYSLVVIAELFAAIVVCPLITHFCLEKPNDSSRPKESVDADEGKINAVAAKALTREDALVDIAQRYDLSKREFEVLELLAAGWRAAAIAEKLVLSTATVKNHMSRIYGKTGVHSQDELLFLIEEAEKEIRS